MCLHSYSALSNGSSLQCLHWLICNYMFCPCIQLFSASTPLYESCPQRGRIDNQGTSSHCVPNRPSLSVLSLSLSAFQIPSSADRIAPLSISVQLHLQNLQSTPHSTSDSCADWTPALQHRYTLEDRKLLCPSRKDIKSPSCASLSPIAPLSLLSTPF